MVEPIQPYSYFEDFWIVQHKHTKLHPFCFDWICPGNLTERAPTPEKTDLQFETQQLNTKNHITKTQWRSESLQEFEETSLIYLSFDDCNEKIPKDKDIPKVASMTFEIKTLRFLHPKNPQS